MRALLLAALLAAPAARAGVPEAVEGHVLPGLRAFAEAAGGLDRAARADCAPAALEPAYQAAWDAWGPIADVRLGPSEAAAFSIAFWPDERGAGPRALSGLLAAEDEAALSPEAFAQQSVAARGLLALDLLLHGDLAPDAGPGTFACALVRAIAADLSGQAARLAADWEAEAEALATPGAEGNARYLSEDEAFRALYTQILWSLEFTADARLGAPMGTFDAPRPALAEAWRSGRPLAEARASIVSAARLAGLLAGTPLPATEEASAAALAAADAIEDPAFQDLRDPTARLRLEILQQRVRALKDAIEAEVGAPRGIEAGFNSSDGD